MSRLPIRIRVTMVAAMAGLIASLAVAGLALWRAKTLAESDLDEFLSREASEVVALISVGGSFASLVDINPSIGPAQRIALVTQSGVILDQTPELPPIPDLAESTSHYNTLSDQETGEEMRVLVVPLDVDGQPALLVLGTSSHFVAERVSATARSMVFVVLSVVTVVASGAFLLTSLVLRPVARLTESARELAQTPAGRRLAVPVADDEIRSLAVLLNEALDRIDDVMRQNREFVAQASHEIRAPLARLAADLEFAQRPTRTVEEVSVGLDALNRHTDDMVRVADELLDLLEERSVPFQPHSISDVTTHVREHVASYRALQITIDCNDQSAFISCDPRQLASAVRNLVDNAFEHGGKPVDLTIECHSDHVDFTVTDNGSGLPPSIRTSLGEPFNRGDGAGRAGLGLAIVSRIVSRMGGEVIVEVEPASRVRLRIPLTDVSSRLTTAADQGLEKI